jgi:primosomal protein N' (replication factor Y)
MSFAGLFPEDPPPPEKSPGESFHLFAQVVFDRPLEVPYTYAVPPALEGVIRRGARVTAPLGRGDKRVPGWCVELTTDRPDRPVKALESVLDPEPLVDDHLLELTRWMADYYLCGWGQALQAVVPAGVRRDSKERQTIWLRLPAVPVTHDEAGKPIKLTELQQAVIAALAGHPEGIEQPRLLEHAKCTSSVVEGLVRKGVLVRERSAGRPDTGGTTTVSAIERPPLTDDQQLALDRLFPVIDHPRFAPHLLFGVTGSGKTEVYLRAIARALEHGKQAIVLVPEISLTPQTESRFRDRFGLVAVLHSHQQEAERRTRWREVASGKARVVIGARSAIFAPARDLGLIVVDEEHEPTFKQETVPRYHARDVALMRARMLKIPVILGSATPSLETYHLARKGACSRIDLPNRVLDRPMPRVEILDRRIREKVASPSPHLHARLVQAIKNTLGAGKQAIVLLNRRGHSPFVVCPACGQAAMCRFCDLALTFHKSKNKLMCHHCGNNQDPILTCASCQQPAIQYQGVGTEKLHEELVRLLPGAVIRRMDSDTMDKPGSHQQVLDAFRAGLVQVLLGTQMIAKGHDFPGVTLVGVVQADAALHFADFRAAERTFQLLAQVAGRAGRGADPGKVLVQAYDADHPAIVLASRHDYENFAKAELDQRSVLSYPPFSRMARIIWRSTDPTALEDYSKAVVAAVKAAHDRHRAAGGAEPVADCRVLGPSEPPVARLKDYFRRHAMIFSPSARHLHTVLREAIRTVRPSSTVEQAIDIDPVSML